MPLVLRKHADKSQPRQEKVVLAGYDADGEPIPRVEAEPWPLAGISLEGGAPKEARVSTHFVRDGRKEGWLSTEGDRMVIRPAGPHHSKDQSVHTFVHVDRVVFHTLDGDVAYKVTHQPDKYVDSDDATEKVTDEKYEAGETRVDSFYLLELEG